MGTGSTEQHSVLGYDGQRLETSPDLRSPSPEPGRRRGSGGQDVKGVVAQRKAHEFAAP